MGVEVDTHDQIVIVVKSFKLLSVRVPRLLVVGDCGVDVGSERAHAGAAAR